MLNRWKLRLPIKAMYLPFNMMPVTQPVIQPVIQPACTRHAIQPATAPVYVIQPVTRPATAPVFRDSEMREDQKEFIRGFVETTRDIVYLRDSDRIMIILPNKIQHLNSTAFDIFNCLYKEKLPPEETLRVLSTKYGIDENLLLNDILVLIESANAIMNEDYSRARAVKTIPYDPDSLKYPILSEIALTYRCQNKCSFCYASSPFRGKGESGEMKTHEVKIIIDKIKNQAYVPSMSFTGGEPTLRKDLVELVEYASRAGLRVNLITNGIRCSDVDFVKKLEDAGLKSVQISLESHLKDVHNRIVGNKNAYENTLKAVRNFSKTSVNVHTNTTICDRNQGHLIDFIGFVKKEFGFPYLSMNMVIRTGTARENDDIMMSYSCIKKLLPPLIDYCEKNEMKFVWYSPTPYCIFNPVDHGLGAKSCAAISGLLSVDPKGNILPCSSFDRGVGNLLKHSFDYIWTSDEAMYWRERRYIPPVCRSCKFRDICCGACPLYWENAGSFREIERMRERRPFVKNILYNIERALRVRSHGISGRGKKEMKNV